jgi:cytochrome b6-f complex iron-sulfur subunit
MACKDCLNRREFLARSALAAAALAVVEGCGDGQFGPNGVAGGGQLTGGPVSVKVADFAGLATVGQPVALPQSLAVVRTGTSTFAAFSTVCTHQGCDTNISGTDFSCPCHDSLFSNTGAVLRGPATQPLTRFNAAFDATTNTITIS